MSVIANVAINVDSRNAVSKLRQVESQAQVTQRAFEALNGVVAAFGAGFAITKVIQDVKELDTNLRRLGTVDGDVKALDKGLGDLSKRLDGIVSKAELAAASYQGLSAGFTDTAGNLKLVEAATKAAIGGMADTTQVVEVLTKTLNAYGLSGSDAVKVTDSISKAIEYGQVEWSDYTSQLGRVASIAAIAGISLDEVNAFIAAATKNGATAEIAFTGLGAAIQTILQPTKESQEAAKALGIQWNLAGLQAKGFDGLLADLAKKQDTNKEAAARLLGSQEAMRGVFSANAKAGKDYQMILAGLQGAAGKTQSDFDQMKVSLENQLKALDTAFKNLSEALGRAFGPTVVGAVKNVADAINIVADVINAIPQPVKTATGELIKLIAQMLLLQKAVQAIIGLRAAFVASMVGMAGATAASGAAAKTSASAFALYTNKAKVLQAQAATATPFVRGLSAALQQLAAFGIITVGINLAVTGLQEFAAAQAEISRLRGERKAGGAAAIFGGSATAEQKATAVKTLKQIKAEEQRLLSVGGFATRTLLGPLAPLAGQPSGVADRIAVLRERKARAEAIAGLPTRADTVETPTPTPIPTGGAGTGRTGRTGRSAIDQAAREAQRAAELAKEQLKAADDQNFALKNQLAILQELDPVRRRFVEYEVKQSEIAKQYNKLKEQAKSADELTIINANQIIDQRIAQIEYEREINELIEQRARLMVELTRSAAMPTVYNELEQQDAVLQSVLDKYPAIGVAADAAASMVTTGVGEMIAGTKSAEQVFVDFLKSVADALLNTAKQMIAQYIAIAIARMFAGLGGGGGMNFSPVDALPSAGLTNALPTSFTGFAEGAFVTGPTRAVVGEGGEPEYVIPASKMKAAMARYSRGARGEAVIPATGGPESGMDAAPAGPVAIDVRYSVERINNVEYVTADQFREGMRQAAVQGATQGEQRTLRRLQMSSSTRRRVGI